MYLSLQTENASWETFTWLSEEFGAIHLFPSSKQKYGFLIGAEKNSKTFNTSYCNCWWVIDVSLNSAFITYLLLKQNWSENAIGKRGVSTFFHKLLSPKTFKIVWVQFSLTGKMQFQTCNTRTWTLTFVRKMLFVM